MPSKDLYGQPIRRDDRKSPKKKTTRTQSRCESWQNTNEPSLARFALFAEDVDDLISGLPVYLQAVARHVLDQLEKPVSLPPNTSAEDTRDVMSVVYRLRFAHRAQLYVTGDPALPPDYVRSVSEISKLYREEMLAAKGFRSASHGISEIKDSNGNVTGYRVQGWGETKANDNRIRTGHIHVGYCKTLEEAYELRAKWWLEQRRIDLTKLICFEPNSAIVELASVMRDAAINAGNDREDDLIEPDEETIEVSPDVIYGEDNESD